MILAPLSEQAVAHVAYNLRAADREELGATMSQFDSARIAVASMRATTGFVACLGDGMPAAVVGASLLWPGVAQVGMFATPRWREIAARLSRHVKHEWIPGLRAAGVRRAHAYSLASHHVAHRWIRWLGGEQEALLRGWGRDGQDFLLFRWE